MFERYDESARRVLFFSRYEASMVGGLTIEPEHLLLGVLRDAPETIARFTSRGSVESLRRTLAETLTPLEQISTSVEIPFSHASKAAIEGALVEAEFLNNRLIGPAHLVLGVIVKTSGQAARALHDAGVDPEPIREYLRSTPEAALGGTGGGRH
jgi:ATP-dependent Clp protease ATP-binding subunit ClpA